MYNAIQSFANVVQEPKSKITIQFENLTNTQARLQKDLMAYINAVNHDITVADDNLRKVEQEAKNKKTKADAAILMLENTVGTVKEDTRIEKTTADNTIKKLNGRLETKAKQIVAKETRIQEVEAEKAEVQKDLDTVLDAEEDRELAGKTIKAVAKKRGRN